jgi:hypothetical protein
MGIRETSTTAAATATLAAPAGMHDWRTRLRAATYALYRRLGEHPALPAEGEVDALVNLIDEGRDESSSPPTLTRVTAEALGGAISHELSFAALGGSLPPEAKLVPTLMYSAVLPYVGASAAAEELRTPPPPR